MADLFDLLKENLGDDLVGAIGGRLGLGGDDAKNAVGLGLPALLGGLANHAGTPEGANALLDHVKTTNGGSSLDGLLDRFRGPRGADDDDDESFIEKALGGGGILEALTGKLGGGGMGKGLMGMLLPLVMGALGKFGGLGGLSPSRLLGALTGAAGRSADEAPGGRGAVASLLGPLAGAVGLGGAGAAAAAATGDADHAVAETVETAQQAPARVVEESVAVREPEPERRRGGAAWLWGAATLGLGLIVAFASGGFGDSNAKAPTPPAASTTEAAPTTTGETPTTGPVVDATPANFLTARSTDAGITLDGPVVDDGTKTSLVGLAGAAFGAENVTDQLRVEEGPAAPAADAVGKVLDALGDGPKGWTAIFGSPDVLTLVGEMASDADKTLVVDAATAAFAPGTIDDQLTVATAAAPVDEINKVIKLRGVTFVTGSANLTPAGQGTLDRIAKILTDTPDVRAEVQGHTDNVGSPAANLALSRQRAASVVAYLVGKGIDKARLEAKGFGQTKPVAPNTTNAGRAANRRVVFERLS